MEKVKIILDVLKNIDSIWIYATIFVTWYFLPTIFAILFVRRKIGAYFAINLMWSWTIIGWFALMKLLWGKRSRK